MIWTFCIVSAVLLTLSSVECVRTLQSGAYKPRRGYAKIFVTKYYAVVLAFQAVIALLWIFDASYLWFVPAQTALCVSTLLKKRKTPLVFTKRVCRLLLANCVLLALYLRYCEKTFALALLPVFTVLSWAVTLPLECAICTYYLQKCRKRVAQSGATVVAVTGSYAKTSVKEMLCALLPGAVCAKGSCNTPLGIAKFVNGSALFDAPCGLDGKFLVLEFGARKKGDVKRLCKLCTPKFGIVTGVCGQHLATFKTLENVAKTKRELVECLPNGGCCVLNGKDEIARSFTSFGECKKVLSSVVKTSEIACTVDGTSFYCEVGEKRHFVTLKQFSVASADNFAMCLALACELGFSAEQIVENAHKVESTPHRLQLVKNGSFYILDDSYNASTAGVKVCAETLAHFDGVKVALLQGIVEGGKNAYFQNVEVGKTLGNVCDVCVVLGANKVALAEGLLQTDCKLLTADSLAEAVQKARAFLTENALLLFQNDLPDNVNL